MPTPAELNGSHVLFWVFEHAHFLDRMQCEPIRERVNDELDLLRLLGVPTRNMISPYHALRLVEARTTAALREQARRGGRAPKTDEFGKILYALVAKKPDTSISDLMAYLREMQIPGGLIAEVSEEGVTIAVPGKALRQIAVKALGDRLSRARLKFRKK